MPIERLRPSFSFDEERLKELKKIAPETLADGKVNWEVLKEALGEHLEDESGEVEHFGLFWPGKKEARKIASIPSKGTLIPVYGEGLKADGTDDSDGVNDSRNIFIEGENLEVLKILQKSYSGRIKMIYIDPPYNTGNEFVYEDDFKEPLLEYLRRTGQTDEEGRILTTNTKSDGRFHSKWLSMMYPRLRLARNLLRNDGVIFVSIDDNEMHHLRVMMNEVFGEENSLTKAPTALIWQQAGTTAGHFAKAHEYILCYAKNKDSLPFFSLTDYGNDKIIAHGALKRISKVNPASEIFFPKGSIKFDGKDAEFEGEIGGTEKQIIKGKLNFKNGVLTNDVTIIAGWAMKEQVLSWLDGKETFDSKGQRIIRFFFNNTGILWYEKERGTIHPKTILDKEIVGTKTGASEILELLGGNYFENPKPTTLVKHILSFVLKGDDITLDFFAGSCTSAQALWELNQEDGGKRQFVLVQMPELLDEKSEAYKAGYRTISEIGKERLRRVVKRLKENTSSDKLTNQDLGFNSFKLSTSNFKDWNNKSENNTTELQNLFDQYLSSTYEGSKVDSLIIEIMLLEGFPLDARINRISEFKSNEVNLISSEFYDHQLIVCLDEKIKEDTINELNLGEKDIFICLDTAIADQDKLRLGDKGLIKTI